LQERLGKAREKLKKQVDKQLLVSMEKIRRISEIL
jgi:hypothetical protein